MLNPAPRAAAAAVEYRESRQLLQELCATGVQRRRLMLKFVRMFGGRLNRSRPLDPAWEAMFAGFISPAAGVGFRGG